MMTTVNVQPRRKMGRKLQLDVVRKMANQILFDLKPHCELIAYTGAIRREDAYLRSIELICVPKMDKQVDLFGNEIFRERSRDFMNKVNRMGTLLAGTRSGSFMKFRMQHKDVLLEIYLTSTEEFYSKLAMTSGPELYTDIKIKDAIRKKGYVQSDHGYRHISDCFFADGKWICVNDKASGLPSFGSELQFFEWLEIDYVTPQFRGKNKKS